MTIEEVAEIYKKIQDLKLGAGDTPALLALAVVLTAKAPAVAETVTVSPKPPKAAAPPPDQQF